MVPAKESWGSLKVCPLAGVAHDQGACRLGRLLRQSHRLLDQVVMGRFAARRVGVGAGTGEQQRLAAAAAEVLFLLVAAAARLWHPGIAAVQVEYWRIVPDLAQALLAHVGNSRSLKLLAWEQGSTLPLGAMVRWMAPQPFMQALGRPS